MFGCLLLTLKLAIVLVIVNTCIKLNNLKTKSSDSLKILNIIFSYVNIVDSRYIGLFMFIISNLLTGFVNLSIKTLYVNDIYAFIILTIYTAIVLFLSYLLYNYLNRKISKSNN